MKKIIAATLALLMVLAAIPGTKVSATAAGVPMHRLYYPDTHEHFYTADDNEKNVLTSPERGWQYEGIAWYAPLTGDPVYRLFNPYSTDHHYTTDYNEYMTLGANGWEQEGIGWYSDPNHGRTLYRLFTPALEIGSHHYTADENERAALLTSGAWMDEGIGWYGLSEGSASNPDKRVMITNSVPEFLDISVANAELNFESGEMNFNFSPRSDIPSAAQQYALLSAAGSKKSYDLVSAFKVGVKSPSSGGLELSGLGNAVDISVKLKGMDAKKSYRVLRYNGPADYSVDDCSVSGETIVFTTSKLGGAFMLYKESDCQHQYEPKFKHHPAVTHEETVPAHDETTYLYDDPSILYSYCNKCGKDMSADFFALSNEDQEAWITDVSYHQYAVSPACAGASWSDRRPTVTTHIPAHTETVVDAEAYDELVSATCKKCGKSVTDKDLLNELLK